MGIAKSLYGIFLSILKRPLVSGSMQTAGGRRNWVSLSRIPGVKVMGYAKLRDSDFDIGKSGERVDYWDERNLESLKKTIDSVMKAGAEYMGEDNRGDHYFNFHIEEGAGKRMKAISNAIKLYTRGDSSHIGMYALWDGG
jgi:hypothetical protein